MASEFIGSTVLVTLNAPPNAQLRGIVQDLQGRVLTLREVYFLDTKAYLPVFSIPGDSLKDLEVVAGEHEDFRPSPLISAPSPNPAMSDHESSSKPVFMDPAIMSIGKPLPRAVKRSDTIASATLSEPFATLGIDTNQHTTSELDTTELHGSVTIKQVAVHTEKVSSPVQQAFQDLMARTLHHASGNAPSVRVQHEVTRKLGQIRQDELPQTAVTMDKPKAIKTRGRAQRNPQDGDSLRVEEFASRKVAKKTRKHSSRISEAQNGWATEEATDIQELGEFDFAANLSKFDKSAVMRQLREEDKIDAGDRLVAHNRLPKPGTSGGRNLHWTENVLDSPLHDKELWNSEAGETDDHEQIPDSGRSSARQKSQSRTRITTSRKGSHNPEDQLRRQSQITTRQGSFEKTASPRIDVRKSFASPYLGVSGTASRNSLRIVDSLRACPVISPIQMLELEQYAIADLGLNEDILLENAARGIAEAAIQMHTEDKRINIRDVKIVIVVGNHKTGARTLAAARHLRNRGCRTTAVVLSREEEIIELVRQQANAFTRSGGSLVKFAELLREFESGFQPTLLIDSMTGIHINLDDVRREDQLCCMELTIWCGRLKVPILSVDVPAGIDPSSGASNEVDGHTFTMHSDVIVALGAPKPYLIPFLEQVHRYTKILVADISLGRSAWKRMGGRRRAGIDFGQKWLVEVSLHSAL